MDKIESSELQELWANAWMLLATDITKVEVDYDGEGDDGSITEIRFIRNGRKAETIDLLAAGHSWSHMIQEAALSVMAGNWEWNNEGSHGTVIFFLTSGRIEHRNTYRMTNPEYKYDENMDKELTPDEPVYIDDPEGHDLFKYLWDKDGATLDR